MFYCASLLFRCALLRVVLLLSVALGYNLGPGCVIYNITTSVPFPGHHVRAFICIRTNRSTVTKQGDRVMEYALS